jgi:O-antigen ligase
MRGQETKLPGRKLFNFVLIFYALFVDAPGNFLIFGQTGSALLLIFVTVIFSLLTLNLILFNRESKVYTFVGGKILIQFIPLIALSLFSLLTESLDKNRIQFLLCLLLLPLTIYLAFAYQSFQDDRAGSLFRGALMLSSILYIITVMLHGLGNSYFYGPRSISMIACVGLLSISHTSNQSGIFLRVIFTACVILSLSRTAFLVAAILNTYYFMRSRSGNSKNFLGRIPLALGILSFSGYLMQSIPSLRDRFTAVGDRGDIFGISVNTNGRSQVWDFLIVGIQDHLVLGQGIGQAKISVSSRFMSIVEPHNDYLRLTYDLGLVGLVLWIFAIVRIAVIIKREKFLSRSASAISVILPFAFAFSDNPIIYPFFLVCFGRVIAMGKDVPTMAKRKLLS